jgi:LPS export ABC transporter protein LptC
MTDSRLPGKGPRGLKSLLYLAMAVWCVALIGCRKKGGNEIVQAFDTEQEMPTLHTEGVTTLISDSGVIKYRITTQQWDMYENGANPRWYFPQGIFVEKFDSIYQTEASIKSDTAYFFKNKKLWRLVGNVDILNQAGDRFQTQELYWDQRAQTIYSDSAIDILKEDVILRGVGFESNERMTKYTIRTPSGIFPIKEKVEPDTLILFSDSIR